MLRSTSPCDFLFLPVLEVRAVVECWLAHGLNLQDVRIETQDRAYALQPFVKLICLNRVYDCAKLGCVTAI